LLNAIFYFFSFQCPQYNMATIQLSLVGGQDKYLNLDADSGFFDSTNITYENFAMQSCPIDVNGQADFGRTVTFKFNNVAELAAGGYIEVDVSTVTTPPNTASLCYAIGWCNLVGIYMFEYIEFTTNQIRVDILYPEFIDMWGRYTIPLGKRAGYNDMIGQMNIYNRVAFGNQIVSNQIDPRAPQVPTTMTATLATTATKNAFTVIMPLEFWWCKDYAHAIPTGLLLFSDMNIKVAFLNYTALIMLYEADYAGGVITAGTLRVSTSTITRPTIVDSRCYIDYVWLETNARNRLTTKSLFYVIKQIKTPGAQAISARTINYKFPASMPVYTLMFGIREDEAGTVTWKEYGWWDRFRGNHFLQGALGAPVSNVGLYHGIPDDSISQVLLKIVNNDRFSTRGPEYLGRYVSYRKESATCIPENKGIYRYDFALYPEHESPSGALNFSRSDNNFLYLTMNNSVQLNSGSLGGVGASSITGGLYLFTCHYNYMFVEGGYCSILYTA
jgi:hypothetical protein